MVVAPYYFSYRTAPMGYTESSFYRNFGIDVSGGPCASFDNTRVSRILQQTTFKIYPNIEYIDLPDSLQMYSINSNVQLPKCMIWYLHDYDSIMRGKRSWTIEPRAWCALAKDGWHFKFGDKYTHISSYRYVGTLRQAAQMTNLFNYIIPNNIGKYPLYVVPKNFHYQKCYESLDKLIFGSWTEVETGIGVSYDPASIQTNGVYKDYSANTNSNVLTQALDTASLFNNGGSWLQYTTIGNSSLVNYSEMFLVIGGYDSIILSDDMSFDIPKVETFKKQLVFQDRTSGNLIPLHYYNVSDTELTESLDRQLYSTHAWLHPLSTDRWWYDNLKNDYNKLGQYERTAEVSAGELNGLI